jgi:hypothetical protein
MDLLWAGLIVFYGNDEGLLNIAQVAQFVLVQSLKELLQCTHANRCHRWF